MSDEGKINPYFEMAWEGVMPFGFRDTAHRVTTADGNSRSVTWLPDLADARARARKAESGVVYGLDGQVLERWVDGRKVKE